MGGNIGDNVKIWVKVKWCIFFEFMLRCQSLAYFNSELLKLWNSECAGVRLLYFPFCAGYFWCSMEDKLNGGGMHIGQQLRYMVSVEMWKSRVFYYLGVKIGRTW